MYRPAGIGMAGPAVYYGWPGTSRVREWRCAGIVGAADFDRIEVRERGWAAALARSSA